MLGSVIMLRGTFLDNICQARVIHREQSSSNMKSSASYHSSQLITRSSQPYNILSYKRSLFIPRIFGIPSSILLGFSIILSSFFVDILVLGCDLNNDSTATFYYDGEVEFCRDYMHLLEAELTWAGMGVDSLETIIFSFYMRDFSFPWWRL